MAGVENMFSVIVGQDGHYTAPVPVIGNTTTVVDVTGSVFQHLIQKTARSVVSSSFKGEVMLSSYCRRRVEKYLKNSKAGIKIATI